MPLRKTKKQKLRKILGAIKPSEKGELMVDQLREDVREDFSELTEKFLEKISQIKKELFLEFNKKIMDIPDSTDDVLSLRNEFNTKVKELETTESKDNLREDFDKRLENLKTDINRRLSNIGGGNMNRQINVNSSVISTRYTDVNFQQFGNIEWSAVNDDDNKRVNVRASVLSDLSIFVPYTGATANVDLGLFGLTAASLTDSGLTATRIPYASTGGLLIDNSALTFASATGLYINANMGIGATPYTFNSTGNDYSINTARTFTDATDLAFKGSYIGEIYWNPVIASVTQYVRGLVFSTNSTVGNTADNTGYFMGMEASSLWRSNGILTADYGLIAKAGTYGVDAAGDTTGTITDSTAVMAQGLKTTSSTITNAYAFRTNIVKGTNAYGLYLAGVEGSSLTYDVYAADSGANNYFAGKVGIGQTTPTALLHLKAGTATASTAPLKFTSGTLLTTAEAGAIEFLTDKFYGTITTGAVRHTFATLESAAQTFSNDISVPDEAYGVGWNGSLEVPTKNAVYDKIETISGGTPGGLDTQVQFNDSGAFAGDAGMVYNKTTNTLTVDEVVHNGITADPTSPADGSIWYRSDLDEFRGRANSITYKFIVQAI